ncbi:MULTISPECIES: hypothetical protein [Fervidobacterium]|uniref:Uncharacterized protein n=2 Tax=Fervidobacterium TaxID=2422 RepID=A0AAI8CM02_FERIS|nr:MULTISPECIES: hypothetical protein [Fervidobacterium]AMW32880.1 hypothetical protein NA23_06115 [Fervidobacterium islandicum]QAV32917.1 hypothetical protein CBS1_03635 [Fervidobacterium changbaicum]
MRKGSLLVEALVAMIIITFSIGIAMVSSFNLLQKSYENQALVELGDILLNECEKIITQNQSQISDSSKQIEYHGKKFTVTITRKTVNYRGKFIQTSEPADTTPLNMSSLANTVVVIVRVTDSKGRYIETRVVPKQW